MGSPFANSIRHGIVLYDDGYLKTLLEDKSSPLKPVHEYYVKTFWDMAYLFYLSPIMKIEKDIKEKHAPDGYCTRSGKCEGHAPGDFLATGIFRMLYMTLPHRGYMPLSKVEVIRFAKEAYGEHAVEVLNKCIEILRTERWHITVDEYRLIKPFAVELYREILRIVSKEVFAWLRKMVDIKRQAKK